MKSISTWILHHKKQKLPSTYGEIEYPTLHGPQERGALPAPVRGPSDEAAGVRPPGLLDGRGHDVKDQAEPREDFREERTTAAAGIMLYCLYDLCGLGYMCMK